IIARSLGHVIAATLTLLTRYSNTLAMDDTQISARISEESKEQVDRFVRALGIKKGALVEQAPLHHALALPELPSDVVPSARRRGLSSLSPLRAIVNIQLAVTPRPRENRRPPC